MQKNTYGCMCSKESNDWGNSQMRRTGILAIKTLILISVWIISGCMSPWAHLNQLVHNDRIETKVGLRDKYPEIFESTSKTSMNLQFSKEHENTQRGFSDEMKRLGIDADGEGCFSMDKSHEQYVEEESDEGVHVEAMGAAAIVSGDRPTAHVEAVLRAKWEAIAEVTGVEIKAERVIYDIDKLDEMIKMKVGAVIKRYEIINEEIKDGTLFVRISAFVVPEKAREAISSLLRNTGIVVFLPVRFPDGTVEDANPFSVKLINALTENYYQVTDIASSTTMNMQNLEDVLKTESFLILRNLIYQHLSNLLIVGKIDADVTCRSGKKIGYGARIPFTIVTARLTYWIIAGLGQEERKILCSGYEECKGFGPKGDDAAYDAMKNLSEKSINNILNAVATKVYGESKRISIVIKGVSDIKTNLEIKDIIQNVPWIMEVKEERLGVFTVRYPERIIYLVAVLSKRPQLRIIDFDDSSIKAEYVEIIFSIQ